MADLTTKYMGIEIKNPLVVGACALSKNVDNIKQLEAAGAGALVIKSLFEEQVQLESSDFDNMLEQYDDLYAEAVNLFPKMEHGGPKEHLYWVKEAKKAVSMPLIASINAVSEDIWVDYARQLADTGVDGLELNFYTQPRDYMLSSSDLEKRELEIFSKIKEAVKLPLAVKLHPFYTNVFQVASSFDRAGASAIVLFNRLFQPDINIEKQEESSALVLSDSRDLFLPLRWTALLYEEVKADLIGNTGILNGKDAIKMILAGANAVQIVSTLYKNKFTHIGVMLEEISNWMDNKGFSSLADIRGRVSKKQVKDPWSFERAQYIKALLGFD
jgi:dihydroorotate dehydrogenase (fumarate)